MPNIEIGLLKPGMILNSDVITNLGRCLVGAGIEITEKHLHVFRTWGITEVDIKDDTTQKVKEDDSVELDPAVYQEVEKELDALFRHTDRNNGFIAKLYRVCINRKLNNGTG